MQQLLIRIGFRLIGRPHGYFEKGKKFGLTEITNLLTVVLSCLLLPAPATARSLYELTVTSEGVTVIRGFNDAQDFINQLNNNGLRALIPGYTETSAAVAVMDIRGLSAIATYPENSTALRFQVPCSNTDLTFQGTTRRDSQIMLREFLKGKGSQSVTDIAQCLVSDTPVDPVAGNPNSLVAMMANSDFRVGTAMVGGMKNLFGIGIGGSYSEASGFETMSLSLPINYVITVPNPSKPPYALIFDLPIRYQKVEGGEVVDGSFGFGIRVPIVKRWALTPIVRAGVVGSENAGALQAAYSGSVTSKADFYFGDLRLSANNMVGYYRTGTTSAGDFQGDYDVQNVIFRNGLALEGSLNYKLLDEPTSWEFQFVDTRVTGDRWFNEWYDDLVLTVGTRQRATRMKWQDLRAGVRYTFGENFNGFEFVLNYRF